MSNSEFPKIPSSEEYIRPLPRVPTDSVFQTQEEKTIVHQEVQIEKLNEKLERKMELIEKLKNTNLALINQNRNLMLENNNLIGKMKKQHEKQNYIIMQQQLLIEQLKQYLPVQQLPLQQPIRPVPRLPGVPRRPAGGYML